MNIKKNYALINQDELAIKNEIDTKLSMNNPEIFGINNMLMRSSNFENTDYWIGGFNVKHDASTVKFMIGDHPFCPGEKCLQIFNYNTIIDLPTNFIDNTYTVQSSMKKNEFSNTHVYPYRNYTFTIEAFNNYAMASCTIWFLGYDDSKPLNPGDHYNTITQLFSGTFGKDRPYTKSFTFTTGPCISGYIRIDNNGKSGSVTDKSVASELWIRRMKLEEGNHFTGWSKSYYELLNN